MRGWGSERAKPELVSVNCRKSDYINIPSRPPADSARTRTGSARVENTVRSPRSDEKARADLNHSSGRDRRTTGVTYGSPASNGWPSDGDCRHYSAEAEQA